MDKPMVDITYDTPIEISVTASPTASVIWLHGLGADGNDFVPVVNMLNLPHVRLFCRTLRSKKWLLTMAMKCVPGTTYLVLRPVAARMK